LIRGTSAQHKRLRRKDPEALELGAAADPFMSERTSEALNRLALTFVQPIETGGLQPDRKGVATMRRLILIAVAALTLTAWSSEAFAGGRVYVYASGGRRYSRPYRTYYHSSRYYPRRTYYTTYYYPRRTYYSTYYSPRRYYYSRYSYPRTYRRSYYRPYRYRPMYYSSYYYDYWQPHVEVYYYYGY
jgi:hypothetical protein